MALPVAFCRSFPSACLPAAYLAGKLLGKLAGCMRTLRGKTCSAPALLVLFV